MRILFINGSPRKVSNTKYVADVIKDIITEKHMDIEYTDLFLKDVILSMCCGCRACFVNGESYCPNRDDALQIKEHMELADAIIVGCPIYVEDVNGLTKVFIDRMAFNCHRPFLCGKPIFIYTVSGGNASTRGAKTLKYAFSSWGGNVVGIKNFALGNKPGTMGSTKEIQLNLYVDKVISKFEKNTVSVFSLISFGIQKAYWTKKDSTGCEYDKNYWVEKGWLDKNCKYYCKKNINMFQNLGRSFITAIIKRFYTE